MPPKKRISKVGFDSQQLEHESLPSSNSKKIKLVDSASMHDEKKTKLPPPTKSKRKTKPIAKSKAETAIQTTSGRPLNTSLESQDHGYDNNDSSCNDNECSKTSLKGTSSFRTATTATTSANSHNFNPNYHRADENILCPVLVCMIERNPTKYLKRQWISLLGHCRSVEINDFEVAVRVDDATGDIMCKGEFQMLPEAQWSELAQQYVFLVGMLTSNQANELTVVIQKVAPVHNCNRITYHYLSALTVDAQQYQYYNSVLNSSATASIFSHQIPSLSSSLSSVDDDTQVSRAHVHVSPEQIEFNDKLDDYLLSIMSKNARDEGYSAEQLHPLLQEQEKTHLHSSSKQDGNNVLHIYKASVDQIRQSLDRLDGKTQIFEVGEGRFCCLLSN